MSGTGIKPRMTRISRTCSRTRVSPSCSIRKGPSYRATGTGVEPHPMRIVSMGGGTGLSTLLQGLKGYLRDPWSGDLLDMVLQRTAGERAPVITDLCAVVAVSDDGGAEGRRDRQRRAADFTQRAPDRAHSVSSAQLPAAAANPGSHPRGRRHHG